MKLFGHQLRLSATDLANFLGCRHATWLDAQLALGKRSTPIFCDPTLQSLADRGQAHEDAYLAHLLAQGRRVEKLEHDDIDRNREQIQRLMGEGCDVIAQAAMVSGRWFGYADLLVRVSAPGAPKHLYEVQDTKLARTTKAGAVLQLALYTDILEDMQGARPLKMTVIAPSADGRDFVSDELTFEHYRAYYLAVRKRFEDAVDTPETLITKPDRVEKCETCRWILDCERDMRAVDHVSFVARSTRVQRKELEQQGITTLTALAKAEELQRPGRGTLEALTSVREQARIQYRSTGPLPEYELLEHAPNMGLSRLPEPCPEGDIYFDFEGDPFVPGGGLEYLFGYAFRNERGEPDYAPAWALTHAEEKNVFESFVDALMVRWKQWPEMHVYHYAPYEPAAMKRLMLRHNTRVAEVDDMLRAKLFIDLYAVVREGVRVGVESYSIKKLEPLIGFERELALVDVGAHKRALEAALEFAVDAKADLEPQWCRIVETYNKHDCQSAMKLAAWLEERRTDLIRAGKDVPRPASPEAKKDKPEKEEQRIQREARERLQELARSCEDAADRSAVELLSGLVEFHAREEKVVWWDLFRLRDIQPDDLREELHALVGLTLLPREEGDAENVERYSYPLQPIDAREGYDVYRVGAPEDEWRVGEVLAIDRVKQTVVIERDTAKTALKITNAYFHKNVPTKPLPQALVRLAGSIADHGLHASSDYRAARDLLLRLPPRLKATSLGLARLSGEDSIARATRIALDLDHGVLPIQGPPGAGKTFTAASMIVELVRQKKTVGVTAVSHKVVVNLMKKIIELDPAIQCKRKVPVATSSEHEVPETTGTDTIFNQLSRTRKSRGKIDVGGGTVWLWANDRAHDEPLDYLFIDEAGQLALANALAVSGAAHNIIMVGDPQQLEQPQRGAHPDGADVSALEHVLNGKETIDAAAGLFLHETWRLHPKIQVFTSSAFYEGRLAARPGLEAQRISAGPLREAGLYKLPVSHAGNRNESMEEVAAIELLLRELLSSGNTWTDRTGKAHALRPEDVLIVAPYNAQVGRLKDRLGHAARIGTVDKFQGQEAPVVIISMASSAAADAPRGIEFLLSHNRLNVATSRAKCACVLGASPQLFEIECRTPRQMRLANALARYDELASAIPWS